MVYRESDRRRGIRDAEDEDRDRMKAIMQNYHS